VLPNDMVNVFITLTARNMSKTLRIIGRAEAPTTEKKLRQAGANEVIMPALSGGLQIAHRITRPTLMDVLNDSSQLLRFDLQELGVDLEQVEIAHAHPLAGHPLSEFLVGNQGRLLILAVQKKNGDTIQSPRNEVILEEGDRLITIARK
jgi:voltage-gated potassium channel